MDPLERMFRHLVRTIRATYPEYLHRPFEAGELYQTIMPYRHHRRELGFETNQDYEMALLTLLSGAGGYLIVDEQVRDRLSRELQSPNPDPGAFRECATSLVALSADAVRATENTPTSRASVRLDAGAPAAPPRGASGASAQAQAQRTSGTTTSAPTASAASAGAVTAPRVSAPTPEPADVRASGSRDAVPQPENCRYCGGALPDGRRIVFCPHCGQNLTVVNCLACGTELELDWKFCTTCGRPAQRPTS